jgi:hypothetical protein
MHLCAVRGAHLHDRCLFDREPADAHINALDKNRHAHTFPNALDTLLTGVLFGFDLPLGNMVQHDIGIGFLQFKDWGLMRVMSAAAGLQRPSPLVQSPLAGGQFLIQPANSNHQAVIGSAIWGVGRGMSGVCPAQPLRLRVRAAPTFCGPWAAMPWGLRWMA